MKEENYVESLLILIPLSAFVILADQQQQKKTHIVGIARTFPRSEIVIGVVLKASNIQSCCTLANEVMISNKLAWKRNPSETCPYKIVSKPQFAYVLQGKADVIREHRT